MFAAKLTTGMILAIRLCGLSRWCFVNKAIPLANHESVSLEMLAPYELLTYSLTSPTLRSIKKKICRVKS